MEYTFNKRYGKNDVNTTFAYDFYVPDHAESIELLIDVKQPKRETGRPDLVGVGIRHKDQVRAWNCTHKKYMKVAKEYGTPGTMIGPIESGDWQVIVFPRTKSEIIWLEVNVRVRINIKEGRFVKGDPHNHTWHSDGRLSVGDMASMAKNNGLDYLFIADHNIASANQSLPKDAGVLVGPGVEYGLEAGHALLLGKDVPIEDFTWDPQWSCYEGHLKEALHNGASIGINHPFWEDTSWDVGFHLPFHWVEVWNGHWRPHNKKAIEWWHEQLCQGKRIPVVGGSDCHGGRPETGTPTTHVWVDELTVDKVIQGYKEGKVYITENSDGPQLEFTTGDAMMGDTSKEKNCTINLTNAKKGNTLKIITDQRSFDIEIPGDNLRRIIDTTDCRFVRLEVWQEDQLILLSNPIYFMNS